MRINNVGVIGVGVTGSVVARRLLQNGLEVTVHDVDVTKVQVLVEAGARPARIPADSAEPAEVVFVHVPDEIAAEDVLFNCGGVGETLREGGVIVLASRTDPAFVRDAATRLAVLGLKFVEAWFVRRTDTPTTIAFVGCSSDELRMLGSLFGPLAEEVVCTGPVGSVAALRMGLAAASAMAPITCNWQSDDDTVGPTGRDCIATLAAVAGELLSWENSPPRYCEPAPKDSSAEAVRPARRDERARLGTYPFSMRHQARDGEPQSGGQHCSSESENPCSEAVAVAQIRDEGTIIGPLTDSELLKVVDAVCKRDRNSRPGSATIEVPESGETNCLGLTSRQFDEVITELEQQFYLPLLREALQCATRAELLSTINTQVTSGV
jgi:hypothetical protein